jgi:hypothetical protein
MMQDSTTVEKITHVAVFAEQTRHKKKPLA